MIEIKDLRAGYGSRQVLHGVSLTIPRGELTTLTGPNGCGKTTLLRALCGLLPYTGKVLFDGRDRQEFGRKEFARMAAFLPQSRDVPGLTVEQLTAHGRYPHLAFGRSMTAADRERVEQALEEAGVADLRRRPLAELSGGQRQRAYLAMALCQDAQVLLLDEPTTYLDVAQKFEVMELAEKCRALGKTPVLVLHDLPLAFQYSGRVAVLEDGCLRAFGPPEEVFDSGVPGEVFGVSARKLTVDGKTEYFFQKK